MFRLSYKHSFIFVAGIIIEAYISEDYDNYTIINNMLETCGIQCLKHNLFFLVSYNVA